MLPTEPEPERFIHSCHRRALQEGDSDFLQDMPVIYCNQNPHHEQLSYEMVKELRKLVMENSLHSSFSVNLIDAISESHTMLLVDWKSLVKTVLRGGRKILCVVDGICRFGSNPGTE
ncbi:hypothetical protein Nmel_001913 [Mimus melanotis]